MVFNGNLPTQIGGLSFGEEQNLKGERKKSKVPWVRLYTVGFGFWVAAAIFTLVYFPLIAILPLKKSQKQNLVLDTNARLFGFFTRLLEKLKLIEVTLVLTPLPREGCLIVSNHPSELDFMLLLGTLPRTQCIVKAAILKNPLLGLPMKLAGYIGNDDPFALIQNCQDEIDKGGKVLIFPEGTRTVPGQPIRFNRGAASIATLTSCKIVPVFISIEPNCLYKGQSWRDLKEFPIRCRVEVGEALDTQQFGSGRRTQNLHRGLESIYQEKQKYDHG
jgi:1-acyl-sn-glycerol-3-phosphate acyltransferase